MFKRRCVLCSGMSWDHTEMFISGKSRPWTSGEKLAKIILKGTLDLIWIRSGIGNLWHTKLSNSKPSHKAWGLLLETAVSVQITFFSHQSLHSYSPSRCNLAKATDQHHKRTSVRRCAARFSLLHSSFRVFGSQGEVLLDGLHSYEQHILS